MFPFSVRDNLNKRAPGSQICCSIATPESRIWCNGIISWYWQPCAGFQSSHLGKWKGRPGTSSTAPRMHPCGGRPDSHTLLEEASWKPGPCCPFGRRSYLRRYEWIIKVMAAKISLAAITMKPVFKDRNNERQLGKSRSRREAKNWRRKASTNIAHGICRCWWARSPRQGGRVRYHLRRRIDNANPTLPQVSDFSVTVRSERNAYLIGRDSWRYGKYKGYGSLLRLTAGIGLMHGDYPQSQHLYGGRGLTLRQKSKFFFFYFFFFFFFFFATNIIKTYFIFL